MWSFSKKIDLFLTKIIPVEKKKKKIKCCSFIIIYKFMYIILEVNSNILEKSWGEKKLSCLYKFLISAQILTFIHYKNTSFNQLKFN